MKYFAFLGRLLISIQLIIDGIFLFEQPIKQVQYYLHHYPDIWLESKQFFVENFSEENNPFSGEQNFQFFAISLIQGLGFLQILLATCIVFGCKWANKSYIWLTIMKSYNTVLQMNFIEILYLMGRVGSLMI